MDAEQPLGGGTAADAVVRVGDTVRKPWTEATPSVHGLMDALRRAGVDVPGVLGRDAQGRQILEHVPGRIAADVALTPADLTRVGRLVRTIHDACAVLAPPADAIWRTAIPAPRAELLSHNDLAPWNLVVGARWVFIDWDAAAPSTRLWDLAYAAQTFTLNDPSAPVPESAARLAAFVSGYAPDQGLRDSLPDALARRTAAMRDMLAAAHAEGREPWASMHAAGHGEHWARAAAYVAAGEVAWREALAGSV